MKLDPSKEYYEQEFGWVAHESSRPTKTEEIKLVKNRFNIEIIGGIQDKDACYSYDDWALCELNGKFYMLATSGCSCPSPTETWRIEKGPATLKEIKKHVLEGDYDGYTMPKKQEQDFIDLIAKAEKLYKKPKKKKK